MRRRLPWILALPLMAAGHSLSYLFVSRATEGSGEASERASTGSASYLVLFLGIVAATGVVAAVARLLLGTLQVDHAPRAQLLSIGEAKPRDDE